MRLMDIKSLWSEISVYLSRKVNDMYRIINVTDKDGNAKQNLLDELRVKHPKLCGEILHKELLASNTFMTCLCFIWADDPDRMLRTSMVLDYIEKGNRIIATTMNSIYTFEKM